MTRNPNPRWAFGSGGTRGGIDPNRPQSSMGGQPSLSQGATSFPEPRGLNHAVETIFGGGGGGGGGGDDESLMMMMMMMRNA